MRVKLNAWHGVDGPGQIVDLDEREATVMIGHGTAWPVDDLEEQLAAAETAPATGRAAKASAASETVPAS